MKLVNGRASRACVYLRALCRAVCEGAAAQNKIDSRNLVAMDVMSLAEINDVGVDDFHEKPEDMEALDDVSNEPLQVELVMPARSEELTDF